MTLLGTAGGPIYWPDGRHGIATAITVGDAMYLVDVGQGFAGQLQRAGLAGPHSGLFTSLRAVFLTHLHLDHIADLGPLLTWGQSNGVKQSRPVNIIGPQSTSTQPGTAATVKLMTEAFGASLANTGAPPAALFRTTDLTLPGAANGGSNTEHLAPWPVYEDDRVRVTTTIVRHGTMRPAHAFRFETADGIITLSGDTTPCANLDTLAGGSHIYVHEAFDKDALSTLVGPGAGLSSVEAAHTDLSQIAAVGNAAHAQALMLTHLSPGFTTVNWNRAANGFKGRLIVGQDLSWLGLSAGKIAG